LKSLNKLRLAWLVLAPILGGGIASHEQHGNEGEDQFFEDHAMGKPRHEIPL
jgi:hypothetical protein